MHDLDGYVLEDMLKVRGELLGLPVTELRIRVQRVRSFLRTRTAQEPVGVS